VVLKFNRSQRNYKRILVQKYSEKFNTVKKLNKILGKYLLCISIYRYKYMSDTVLL